MIGANALWLMYLWLACAIVASYLSTRKGFTREVGAGQPACCFHIIGVIILLVIPAKPNSKWKTVGPFGRRKGVRRRSARGRQGRRGRDARAE